MPIRQITIKLGAFTARRLVDREPGAESGSVWPCIRSIIPIVYFPKCLFGEVIMWMIGHVDT